MWRLCIGILAGIFAIQAPAELYKWTDDDGNVHYSDSIPSEEAKKRREREVKSESGVTKRVIEPPPTDEELEQRRQERLEAKRELERQRRQRERQAERDRRLNKMYTSVAEIKEARDDRLQSIEAEIKLREKRIESIKSQIEKRQERAARLERSDHGDPDGEYDAIDRLERSLAGHQSFIENKKQKKQQLKQHYARDIERFREIHGGAETAQR
jgi:chromosome segregation ATPase